MRGPLILSVVCAAYVIGDVFLDNVTSLAPPGAADATLSKPAIGPVTEPSTSRRRIQTQVNEALTEQTLSTPRPSQPPSAVAGPTDGAALETEGGDGEDEYYDDDDYENHEDENYEDEDDEEEDNVEGSTQEQDEEDDDDEFEDVGDEGDYEDDDQTEGSADLVEGSGDSGEQGDEEVVQDLSRRAEVRSLSDLPLSKLLQVQSELRSLAGQQSAAHETEQCSGEQFCEPPASKRWSARPEQSDGDRLSSPSAQALNWGGRNGDRGGGAASSTRAPQRRGGGGGGGGGGGWHQYEEYEEAEEEEEEGGGGWITWNKGKKKGKGDIGSVFQVAVTFLAFLAFGGYLLCLIIQAVKGGNYPYPVYSPLASQGQVRPASNVMMLMMSPTRLSGTRRPTRPAATGRRRRAARPDTGPENIPPAGPGGEPWWPSWIEEDRVGLQLWPHVDAERMHQALLLVAEGYAAYYHKKYVQ